MSSPRFFKVLVKFFLRLKNRVQFPYTYVLTKDRQEIVLLDHPRKDKLKLQASSIFLLLDAIYCFVCLCWCYKQRKDRQLRIEQILIILLQFFLSACFMTIHFVISFRPDVRPAILNAMVGLEKRIQSKMTTS